MFVDSNLLKRYHACGSGLTKFEEEYPNGVDSLIAIREGRLSPAILHWAANYLPASAEEMEEYYKAVRVFNSKNVKYSENVESSENIWFGDTIYDSSYIKNCKNIKKSHHITNSTAVSDSTFIMNSTDIQKSSKICGANRIKRGYNISQSSNLVDSVNIFNSHDLFDSNTAYNSHSSEFIGYSSFIENSRKCLFCTGIEGGNLLLFNKPISFHYFQSIWDEFSSYMNEEDIDLIKEQNTRDYYDVKLNNDLFSMFGALSYGFKQWVKELPNFDNFIMYQITFDKWWIE